MTILAIEGAEGVGKTTVLQELHRLTGAPIIRPADLFERFHRMMPRHTESEVWRAAIESAVRLCDRQVPLVLFDRLWLSTLVYQHPDEVGDKEMKVAFIRALGIHTILAPRDTYYTVLLHCDEAERQRRLRERGRPEKGAPNAPQLYLQYYEMIPQAISRDIAGVFAIADSTTATPSEIATQILSGLKIA